MVLFYFLVQEKCSITLFKRFLEKEAAVTLNIILFLMGFAPRTEGERLAVIYDLVSVKLLF